MAKTLKGASNRRGAGVGAAGTAPGAPKEQFYSRPDQDGDVLDIVLDDISPNPFNKDRAMGDLRPVAESIKEDGLLQDIVVMHTTVFAERWPDAAAGIETKYVLAFGERRWRATRLAELPTIRSVLRNAVVDRIRRVLLIENLQRKNYTPMEEARNFYQLHTEEGMSYREIADAVKIGPTHVSRRMQLLSLPSQLQDAVESGDLGPTHARRLLEHLEGKEAVQSAWSLMAESGASVNEAIRFVQQGGVPPGNTSPEVPEQRSEEEAASSSHETSGAESSKAAAGHASAPEPKKRGGHTKTTPVLRKADKDLAERNNAASDRAAACQRLISSGVEPDPKELAALYARTILVPYQQGPARVRAHDWLRAAGKNEFAVSDTDGYVQAVLSSSNQDLINLLTFATALAANEIRAKDGRRQWDQADAAHVQYLIEAAGYRPQTAWERKQLVEFGVRFEADEPATNLPSEPLTNSE